MTVFHDLALFLLWVHLSACFQTPSIREDVLFWNKISASLTLSYSNWMSFDWMKILYFMVCFPLKFFILPPVHLKNLKSFFFKELFWLFHIQIEFPLFEWKSYISWLVVSWNSLFFLWNSKKFSNSPFKTKKKARMSSFCCIKPPQALLYLNKFSLIRVFGKSSLFRRRNSP